MDSLQVIGAMVIVNSAATATLLLLFAILRLRPVCDRFYFPKLFGEGIGNSPERSPVPARKLFSLDFRTYFQSWNWMPDNDLLDHGLDSAAHTQIYLLGFKIFAPLTVLSISILLPINWMAQPLESRKDLTSSNIDNLSIANVPSGSEWFGALVVVIWFLFTLWTCYCLYYEYEDKAETRMRFLRKNRSPDQYTEAEERDRIKSDPMDAAFVSFKTTRGAAACANQQSINCTDRLTEGAPKPRDVFWENTTIPYAQMRRRKFLMGFCLFLVTVFPMFLVSFVLILANSEVIKAFPFLMLMEMKVVKSSIHGFVPALALKLVFVILPKVFMAMSKFEGFASLSSLERSCAGKYHVFIIFNVIPGCLTITVAALQQLRSSTVMEIARFVEMSMLEKANFFIVFIMVDGWLGLAAEILRISTLVKFYWGNAFLAKTDRDREQEIDPGCLEFSKSEPLLQLYFLVGFMYSVVSPLILPFITAFFTLGHMVSRRQVIHVYKQKFESGAAFWPDVHRRLIIALMISHLFLMGVLSTKFDMKYTPFFIILLVSTLCFHKICERSFKYAFVKFPIRDAVVKETSQDAYMHPILKN